MSFYLMIFLYENEMNMERRKNCIGISKQTLQSFHITLYEIIGHYVSLICHFFCWLCFFVSIRREMAYHLPTNGRSFRRLYYIIGHVKMTILLHLLLFHHLIQVLFVFRLVVVHYRQQLVQ